MNRIKRFCILKVSMNGFKRFAAPFEVELSELCYITGHNEEGKTSIVDAIAFAFCGCPVWGEKSSERLLCKETQGIHVEIHFVDENGEAHHLIRRRFNNQTTVTLDTIQIRQADITQMFAEKDIFLSILNPLYFIEKIAEDGRAFLQKLLPPVDQKTVLSQLSKETACLLKKESLLDPEYYVKTRREEIKKLMNDNTYLQGQLDLLQKQQYENDIIRRNKAERQTELLQKITELEELQYREFDKEKLITKKEELLRLLTCEERKTLFAKQAKLEASEYQPMHPENLSNLETEINSLAQQYKKLAKLIKGIKPGMKCPVCFHEITEQNFNDVKSELQRELTTITSRGQQLTKQKNELMLHENKSKALFLQQREADTKRVEESLQAIGDPDPIQISIIDNALRYGNLTEKQYQALCDLKEELKKLEEFSSIESQKSQVMDEINRLKETISLNEKSILLFNNLIYAAVEFAAKQAEISLSHLKMDKAAIKLYDVAKSTGIIKNVFRFTYNGLDYRSLSTSQKVKAGIEVANLLRSLTGCNYPTFIDNAECITTDFQKPKGQTLYAYATKSELTVTHVKLYPAEEAA